MDAQQELIAPRITNACETCRTAKVKCQASNQLGICRRCLDSKRECVFKTGPRTRRPRQSKLTPNVPCPAPPAGPSKTFTIDIPMPAEVDLIDNLESLRTSHEAHIQDLVSDSESSSGEYLPQKKGGGASGATISTTGSPPSHSSFPTFTSTPSTPPLNATSRPGRVAGGNCGAPRSVASLGVQPQFNLASAEQLLARFAIDMLLHFPAVVLRRDEGNGDEGESRFSIPGMARRSPFVLLAVLAAASGSRTLQGHSLYDEEFRKILGLKFVAAGERSLELLQGLVVYIAWYPFHLRPKNRQAFQYVRMAVDIINDLELDQDPGDQDLLLPTASEGRLGEIRTYLATYCLVSNFATTWTKAPSLQYTDYTAKCCDILERDSSMKGDHVLVWLVRLQHIAEELNHIRRTRHASAQNECQVGLMLKGMETQLNEWENRMSPEIASTTSVRLALLTSRIFVSGAPFLKLPRAERPSLGLKDTFRAGITRLPTLISDLRNFFEYVLVLPGAEFNSFCCTEWAGFIIVVIVGFRMSLPLPGCPAWDDAWARREMGFQDYLDRLTQLGEGSGRLEDIKMAPSSNIANMDILSASKVVLNIVRKKWEERVAKLEPLLQPQPLQQEPSLGEGSGLGFDAILSPEHGPMRLDRRVTHCPMMDGSLDSYIPYWDETFTLSNTNPLADIGGGNLKGGAESVQVGTMNPDLWAAMTMDWTQLTQPDLSFDEM